MRLTMPARRGWRPGHNLGPAHPAVLTQSDSRLSIAARPERPRCSWRIERDYLELKQEVGLDHYEGPGWRGFHHRASLCIADSARH
jgi:SRSO17 transposase